MKTCRHMGAHMTNGRFVRETFNAILREAMVRSVDGVTAIDKLVDRCIEVSLEMPRFFVTELVGGE